MKKDATQQNAAKKGVSDDDNKEKLEAQVAEIRETTHKDRSEGISEVAAKVQAEREDDELVPVGDGTQDDSDKEPPPDKPTGDKTSSNNDQKTVDNDEKTVKLNIDGKEQEVSESKILEAGTRALQKDLAADSRLEEATKILTEAKETASKIESSSQPSNSQADVDDTATLSKEDREALAKSLVDGDVEEVATALEKIGIGRETKIATQVQQMDPNEVYGMVESALQMKDALKLFESDPESGGYGDLYADETMRQMVFDKEAELAKSENPEPPGTRLQKAAEEVREWRNGLIKQSGGNVVEFGDRKAKKTDADSTPTGSGSRKPDDKNERPKSEAEQRREVLKKMARSRGQLD